MTQRVVQGSDRKRPRRPRLPAWSGGAKALVGAGVIAAVLVACGDIPETKPVSGSSSARPTDVPAPKQWNINVGDLPKGWQESSPPNGEFRFTVCGVDLEPVLAIRAGQWRWSQSALGPFLDQYVRVYPNDQAQEVISALEAALPTCTKTEAPKSQDSSEKATLTIEPITVAGAGPDTVAWRQTLVSDRPITAEIVLTRRGRTLVLFDSRTIGTNLDRNVLVQAVAALEKTPKS